MQNSSTIEGKHKRSTRLWQPIQFTTTITVTIKRLVGDNQTEDVISFTNAPDIQAFFARRGVALGITQATNAIAIRGLALELHKKSQYQQKLGLDSASQVAEQARLLHAVAHTLKKDDSLVCSFVFKAPTNEQ